MNKTTLVIHPKDPSTDCLGVIYEGRDWTVIRDFTTPQTVVDDQISKHDRIILLGHGSPEGLLAGAVVQSWSGQKVFKRFSRYIISPAQTDLLKEKETFSIWCCSDAFFKKYQAGKGLHTGMIISEVGEEVYCLGKAYLDEKQMASNMELFCGAFAKHIDLPPEEMRRKVLEEYVGDDPVTRFNRERIVVL